MTDHHDPLCPFAQWPEESCYQQDAGVSICAVIRKSREDTLAAAHAAVAALPHEDGCCSKGCACQTWDKQEPCDLSCNCSFWWMPHALAAIDALRGSDVS